MNVPAKVLLFSPKCSPGSTRKSQQRTPSKATSTKPLPPLLALCEEKPLPPRLLGKLRALDPEQLQIVEIVVTAIARGHT